MSAAVIELKKQQAAAVRETFEGAISAVIVDYSGINVTDITELRAQFRAADVEYKVVKNSILRKALEGTDIYSEGLKGAFTGMTAIAWSKEDPSSAAKIIKEFRKSDPKREALEFKGSLLEGEFLDANRTENELANLPGKNELRSMLLSVLQAPAQQLVRVLNAPGQNLAQVLSAKADKG